MLCRDADVRADALWESVVETENPYDLRPEMKKRTRRRDYIVFLLFVMGETDSLRLAWKTPKRRRRVKARHC